MKGGLVAGCLNSLRRLFACAQAGDDVMATLPADDVSYILLLHSGDPSWHYNEFFARYLRDKMHALLQESGYAKLLMTAFALLA